MSNTITQETKPVDNDPNPNNQLSNFNQQLLNTQFTFDSTLPQDNLQLNTNTP